MIHAFVILAALTGFALAAYAWMVEGTGVSGTGGALLALAGAVAVLLGAIVALLPTVGDRFRGVLVVLTGAGALLTALAAWFLMQDAFAIAMAVTVLLLLAAMFRPRRHAGRSLAR